MLTGSRKDLNVCDTMKSLAVLSARAITLLWVLKTRLLFKVFLLLVVSIHDYKCVVIGTDLVHCLSACPQSPKRPI